MARVDYPFATVPPFSCPAGARPEEIAQERGAARTCRQPDRRMPFARAGGAAGGAPVPERPPGRRECPLRGRARRAKVAGLPVELCPTILPLNRAFFSHAPVAAREAAGGDPGAQAHGCPCACRGDGRNIAKGEVIRGCPGNAGGDPALSDSGLPGGAGPRAASLEEAATRGAFGASPGITAGPWRVRGHERPGALCLAGRF